MTLETYRQVTLIGLGLIGGSIAKGLRTRCPEVVILAVDRGHVGERSDVQAVVDTFIDLDHVESAIQQIGRSDLVVLAQPVRAIAESLPSYLTSGCAVTDTGSTKRWIARGVTSSPAAPWFVPGHPMAGKAQGGFENASADLFVGRPWIVCPEGRHPEAVRRVCGLAECLGARLITMTPEAHDAAVAWVSHAPQLLSSWLKAASVEHHATSIAGPAFADMTRVAGGAEAIWRDIFETNADEVGRVLQDAAQALASLSEALLAKPPRIEPVLELLADARRGSSVEPL